MVIHAHVRTRACTKADTYTHTPTCIVAHIPLQAGPAHKGHHVALYSLWHEAPTLPALHCPLPTGEHAPKRWPLSSSVFIPRFLSLSLPFPLVYRAWTEIDVPVSKVQWNLRWMGACLWWNTFGKSGSRISLSAFVSRQISNLRPTEVVNIVVKRRRKRLIAWISVK